MEASALAHGTIIERRRGQPVRAVERHGLEVWRASWDGARLRRFVAARPDRTEVMLETDAGEHPLFGPADAISVGGEHMASCGAVDWAAPRFVPPIDRPQAIPSGGGSAILNFLAMQAPGPLHYRGPYPTAELFDALLHSFTVDDPRAALRRFTDDALDRALDGEMREIDVEFRPAPHERIWPAPRVCVELRDGVERVYVDGRAYERGTTSHRELVASDGGFSARIVIAGEPWCDTLRLAADGEVIDGPHEIPAVASPLLGDALPEDTIGVLAELFAARDGSALAFAVEAAVRERRLAWGDTGDALAVGDDREIRVHALLGERLTDCSSERVLALLVDAIEPVARRLAVQDLACKLGRLA